MNLLNEGAPCETGDDAAGSDTRLPKKIGDLQKTITMATIAKAAGVSQGAISSLLNDRDYGIRVSEKTRERVFKVCREMGYIPNDLRAVVRMYPELGDCCLLISTRHSAGIADPFIARLASAAMAEVSQAAHPLTISFYDDSVDYLDDVEKVPHPVCCGVSSKFLLYGRPNASLFESMRRRGAPAVSLGEDAACPAVLSLVPDYSRAARLALEHLFSLGHQRVGIISGPFGATDFSLLELNQGVRLACDEHRVPLSALQILHTDLTEHAGTNAVGELLARDSQISAIFCLSDAAALGVLAGARAKGLRVPDDLSVIGCGNDGCARVSDPGLTTVHLPAEEMGSLGVQQIERLVRAPLAAQPRKVILPVHLVERSSTAPGGNSPLKS
ncbi:MAG TPA: LacI family DNA-binding transcriptional regulator [Chthoniobacteraceae bacterium]|jgi:DNA-binding LacI/PurR family transcriptional regulator